MGFTFTKSELMFFAWVDYIKRWTEWNAQEPKWWQFKKHREWKKAEPQLKGI